MNKVKRIYIFGLSASGKTSLAKVLSKKLKIKVYSLDDISWKRKWTERFPEKVQKERLEKIYTKSKWIIEGVHTYDWIKPVIAKADKVIFLNIPKLTLIKRALKRAKKNKRKSILYQKLRLIYWILRFGARDYRAHKKNSREFIEIRDIKQLNKFLKSLK